jgi:hypothetical protein
MKKKLQNFLSKIELIKIYYLKGKGFLNDPHFLEVKNKSFQESSKRPFRSDIINYLLSLNQRDTFYLEIGVRNPDHNFNLIKATKKYSVDPGLEYEPNTADFKMTSDFFFRKLSNGEILSIDIKFDIIFIDGLHLSEQVDRDIINSLKFIKDDGFIVLHDCNPPTEWHARENYKYGYTPAQNAWNGTTWKAFLKWRCSPLVKSCCIDSDWGVGILSKNQPIGEPTEFKNSFFEFSTFNKNRKENLNLIDFETFRRLPCFEKRIGY